MRDRVDVAKGFRYRNHDWLIWLLLCLQRKVTVLSLCAGMFSSATWTSDFPLIWTPNSFVYPLRGRLSRDYFGLLCTPKSGPLMTLPDCKKMVWCLTHKQIFKDEEKNLWGENTSVTNLKKKIFSSWAPNTECSSMPSRNLVNEFCLVCFTESLPCWPN